MEKNSERDSIVRNQYMKNSYSYRSNCSNSIEMSKEWSISVVDGNQKFSLNSFFSPGKIANYYENKKKRKSVERIKMTCAHCSFGHRTEVSFVKGEKCSSLQIHD